MQHVPPSSFSLIWSTEYYMARNTILISNFLRCLAISPFSSKWLPQYPVFHQFQLTFNLSMRDQVSHPYTTTREVITDATEILTKRANRGLVYKSTWCYYSSRRSYGPKIYPQRDKISKFMLVTQFFGLWTKDSQNNVAIIILYLIT